MSGLQVCKSPQPLKNWLNYLCWGFNIVFKGGGKPGKSLF